MQKLIALACTVAAALAAQPAGAATCSRWQNQLSDCDVLDALCPNKTPSYEQSVIIDGQMYGDTPQDVCTKWANNAFEPGSPSYGKGTLAKTSSSPDSSWECYADANGDGVQQSTENDQLMYVNGNLQTEDCCSYIPKGPYARTLSDTVSPVAGRDFRSTQKDAVRAQNVVDLGTPPLGTNYYWSDMVRYSDLRPFETYGAGPTDQKWQLLKLSGDYIYLDSASEVDHLIPKKDKKGCACGTNFFANALLISRGLNRKMSNNCGDPARQAILARYTSMVAVVPADVRRYAALDWGPSASDAAPGWSVDELTRLDSLFWL